MAPDRSLEFAAWGIKRHLERLTPPGKILRYFLLRLPGVGVFTSDDAGVETVAAGR